jgi:hypothetical protein
MMLSYSQSCASDGGLQDEWLSSENERSAPTYFVGRTPSSPQPKMVDCDFTASLNSGEVAVWARENDNAGWRARFYSMEAATEYI